MYGGNNRISGGNSTTLYWSRVRKRKPEAAAAFPEYKMGVSTHPVQENEHRMLRKLLSVLAKGFTKLLVNEQPPQEVQPQSHEISFLAAQQLFLLRLLLPHPTRVSWQAPDRSTASSSFVFPANGSQGCSDCPTLPSTDVACQTLLTLCRGVQLQSWIGWATLERVLSRCREKHESANRQWNLRLKEWEGKRLHLEQTDRAAGASVTRWQTESS